jgi:hypothetical protein
VGYGLSERSVFRKVSYRRFDDSIISVAGMHLGLWFGLSAHLTDNRKPCQWGGGAGGPMTLLTVFRISKKRP